MYQYQEVPKKVKPFKSKAFKDRLKGHRDTIICLVSPYGQPGDYLFSASRDGQIRAWDLINRDITVKLLISRVPNETTVNDDDEHKQPIKSNLLTAATFSEKSIYSGYEDGFICSRNIRSGELLYMFDGHKAGVTGMEFLNVRQLVTCSVDGSVRVWDTTCGQCEIVFNIGYPINQMRVCESEIDVLYGKNTLVQINPERQTIIRSFQFPNLIIMSFLRYKSFVILGTIDNSIQIYDLSNLDHGNSQPLKVIAGGQGWALCMSVLEPYIYIGTDDKKIKVYDLKSWELKEELDGHVDGVTTLAFANGMLYSGSYDHLIRSWDLQEMYQRIRERAIMYKEDLNSRRYEVYLKSLPKKKKAPIRKK